MAQLQTLVKALDILTLLGQSDHPMSVEELAVALGLPKSTVYRLIQTLEAKDFARRYSRSEIDLGYHFINLGRSAYGRIEQGLLRSARPLLQSMAERYEETAILSIRSGLESVCIYSVPSRHPIRFTPEDHRALPLYVGASSLAILAWESQSVVAQVLDQQAEEAGRKKLACWLEEIRSQGYVITDNQFDSVALGIAAPVYDNNGKIYASVALVGPDSRMLPKGIEIYIAAVREVADKITQQLKSK